MARMITSGPDLQPGEPSWSPDLQIRERSAREVEVAMLKLHESNARLQAELGNFDEALVVGIDRFRLGTSLGEMVELFPTITARKATEEEITGHFEARRLLRSSVIHALFSDGMDVREISQIFDVPVEVVSAFAPESRAGKTPLDLPVRPAPRSALASGPAIHLRLPAPSPTSRRRPRSAKQRNVAANYRGPQRGRERHDHGIRCCCDGSLGLDPCHEQSGEGHRRNR